MEGNVQHREAVFLRGAGQAVQAAHGEVPRLQVRQPRALRLQLTDVWQVPAAAQEDLHSGRQEAPGLRVQGADEDQAGGDEAAVVSGRQSGLRPQCQSPSGTVLSHPPQHHGVRGSGRVQGLGVSHIGRRDCGVVAP